MMEKESVVMVMGNVNVQSNLFVLKHKDLDVAMVQIDVVSGKVDYILDIYMPEELPVGCNKSGAGLREWWEARAIPDSRRGIQQVLHYLKEASGLSLMLCAYGLSLTDHYWMQPIGQELYWKDLNFYENDFSDELGDLLTETGRIDIDSNISKFSPSSSVNGEMKKKWVIIGDTRYLLKVNTNDYGQQSVNELIASRLHDRLGWQNYVSYEIGTASIEGELFPCSISPLFTSTELEFISAYQLIRNYKIPNSISNFEAVIDQAVELGMSEKIVRRQMEYTIMTDFILTNTDRHLNNFGFLYHPAEHKLISMAPIFDTGNALFYNKDMIPTGSNLLDIKVTSFSDREVNLLRYVSSCEMIDLERLDGFYMEAENLLKKNTKMPAERAEKIARTICQKIEYLRMFQQGKKIWKKERFW